MYPDFTGPAGAFGAAAVAGEEADRRRQQSAALDAFLRRSGVQPGSSLAIDPLTAGQSLDAIARRPAPAAPPARPAAPPGPSYTPAEVGRGPQAPAGVGSFAIDFQPSDPVIGAGINIRDTPEVELAKMNAKRQTEAAAWEAANASNRNEVAARGLDASLFNTQAQQSADRERLLQGERAAAAQAGQFDRKLLQDRDLAERAMDWEREKQRFAVGPEMGAAAERAAVLDAITKNPGQASQILDAITRWKNGMPAAPPKAAAPGGPGAPGWRERPAWWPDWMKVENWGGSGGPAAPAPRTPSPVEKWAATATAPPPAVATAPPAAPAPAAPDNLPPLTPVQAWTRRNVIDPVRDFNYDPEYWMLRMYGAGR